MSLLALATRLVSLGSQCFTGPWTVGPEEHDGFPIIGPAPHCFRIADNVEEGCAEQIAAARSSDELAKDWLTMRALLGRLVNATDDQYSPLWVEASALLAAQERP